MRSQAQTRGEIERAIAQLDAAGAVFALSDQQRIARLAGALQLPRCRHVQPLVMAQFARQRVGDAEAAAIEIEPHLPLQMQLVALPAFIAPAALFDRQARIVVKNESRQLAPLARHTGLGGIGGLAFDARAAQVGVVGIAPDFLARPRRGGQFQRHLVQRRHAARVQRHGPLPRTQLHTQMAIAFQPGRQVAGQGGGDEAGGQHRPQPLFARTAADGELHLGLQRGRKAVAEAAIDAQRQRVGGTLRRGRFTQRELIAVAFGTRHRRAIDAQRDQPDHGRHAQARGTRRPRQRAAQLIVARRQPQHRRAAALQHGGCLLVDADLLRPGPGVARQRHPARRIHVHVEIEAAAVLVRIHGQPARPCALVTAIVRHRAGEKRAAVLRHVVQHPALPVAQRRRYLLRQRRHGDQQPQQTQQPEAGRSWRSTTHAFLPVCLLAGTV